MKWNNELALELIDEYKKFPILWNSRHPWYYSRKKKLHAWDKIGHNLNTTAADVKQKMNSLLGSLRRERTRGMEVRGAGNAKKVTYSSNWFAFTRMEFLLHKDQHLSMLESTDDQDNDANHNTGRNVEYIDIKQDIDDLVTAEETQVKQNSKVVVFAEPLSSIKGFNDHEISASITKKSANENARLDSSRNMAAAPTDSCNVYGQHVANKLSTYSKQTRSEVEYRINQVLYNADMGKYDKKMT